MGREKEIRTVQELDVTGMSNYRELDARYYQPVFSREIQIVRGSGTRVWDAEGREFLDLVAGIAVCSTGH